MNYSFKDRLAYNGRRQNAVRGELVTYSRGAASVHLYQVPGHTDVQDFTPENVITVGRYVDFIFFSKDLILPGLGLTLPLRGDLVEWEDHAYTATAPGPSDDVYNFTTMYRDRIRLHTIMTR